MKIASYFLFIALTLLSACVSDPPQKIDLVFHGTVKRIYGSPTAEFDANWVVELQVDQVIRGKYPGKAFAFRVQSASMSGLEEGRQYRVEATQTSSGYMVDQNQWR